MKRLKYFPTQDYSFLLDENHYVYDHVENEDSLHIYIKSREHGCYCPVCGKISHKLHATEEQLREEIEIQKRFYYLQKEEDKENKDL